MLVFGLSLFVSNLYLKNHKDKIAHSCLDIGVTHIFTIKNNILEPKNITGRLCDRLTVFNKDNVIRLMAFGKHDHHEVYDGIVSEAIAKNQYLTVILNKSGTYLIHDHIHDSVNGSFTVL